MTNRDAQRVDHQMMHHALQLARKGCLTTSPNPAVGCVITQQQQIIGEGWHQRAGQPHAEVNALADAGEHARGGTAYVTLEPCSHHGRTPPCVDALLAAQVSRVVIAMQDPNPAVAGNGIRRLRQAGIEVDVGVLEQAAQQLNPGFVHRMEHERPFVRVKLAASMDARTALANGKSQWITGAGARADVQYWRAQADAILTASATVLADNPQLTVRAHQWPATRSRPELLKQPVRVIIDSRHQIHDDLALFEQPSPVWLVRTEEGEASRHAHCHQLIVKQTSAGNVDLNDLLLELGLREINMVWTECGPSLAGALMSQRLVNQLFLYQSNQLLGMDARAMLDVGGLNELQQATRVRVTDRRQVGGDSRIIGVPEFNE